MRVNENYSRLEQSYLFSTLSTAVAPGSPCTGGLSTVEPIDAPSPLIRADYPKTHTATAAANPTTSTATSVAPIREVVRQVRPFPR